MAAGTSEGATSEAGTSAGSTPSHNDSIAAEPSPTAIVEFRDELTWSAPTDRLSLPPALDFATRSGPS